MLTNSRAEPLVSIITVSHNALGELRAVFESVLALKSSDVEFLVIDAASSDGTLEYLQSHTGDIDYWVSEPDAGIYDAMNKAIRQARGTYLLHLNAGDRLLQIPYRELQWGRDHEIDILAFRVALDRGRYFQSSYGYGLIFQNTLHHQGTFFRRAAFPGYQAGYRVFADFDANQRMALAGATARVYDQVVSYHATDGVSNQNTSKAVAEFFHIIVANHGRRMLPLAWLLCKWQGLRRRLASSSLHT